MHCKKCQNIIDDIAFIGGLCIDCYDEEISKYKTPLSRAADKIKEAINERAKRKGREDKR